VLQACSGIAEMQTSVDDSAYSAERVREVIRVIDEITFQTNVLALNAAAEAARTGEAGQMAAQAGSLHEISLELARLAD
jgi:methyl-accepting chemotaxis protein